MLKLLARAYLKLTGWSVESDIPDDLDKFVIIAAPHTSNWDFPKALAVAAHIDLAFKWVGKHTLFRRPFRGLMLRLGGVPVDRRKSENFVEQIAEAFEQSEEMALAIAPEGTRSNSKRWKTGFYYIAKEANVPIVCGFLDWTRKVGGLGPVIEPDQSLTEVMDQLREFYDGIDGKRPRQFTPPRLEPRTG